MSKIDLNKKYNLTHINWTLGVGGSSDGILPKTILDTKKGRQYLKLGSFSGPFGFYGIEPIVELINSRIGKVLNLPVLDYDLRYASVLMDDIPYDTLVSVSNSYRGDSEQGISFENFYEYHKQKGETTIDFVKRFRLDTILYKQFLFDFIICNLDRHGKNTEVLLSEDNKGNLVIKLAPFFDNSFTFIANRPENELVQKIRFNDMLRINNFIGSQNLLDNLLQIDKVIKVREPRKEDRQSLFQGLGNITTQTYRDFVWDLLNRRVEDVKSKKISFIQWY